MAWRVFSVSTSNWQSKVELTPSASTWTRSLNAGGGGSTSFLLGDPEVAEVATEANLEPWERMIVMDFYGQLVYAGFITSFDYDFDKRTVTVTHEDLWTLLKKRLMADIVQNGVQTTALVYTGVSLANLAKQAVYQGQNDAARFNLPISLPADESGSVNKTYYGYHLPTVASVLDEIMNTESGPDIDFEPRWLSDGSLEWLMRVGSLTSGTWSWDVSAPLTTASGLKIRKDGTSMVNRMVGVGEGSEKNMVLRVDDASATSSFLPLDDVASYKSESSGTRLDARTRADRRARDQPTTQVSMNVQMDADFSVDQLSLGGTVNWRTQGDPLLADGWTSSRLIEFSGDLSLSVHLEFQPIGG